MAALFSRHKDPNKPTLKALTRQAELATHPLDAATIYTQAADLAIELDKGKRAIELYNLALKKAPLHEPAAERLEALLRKRKDLPSLKNEFGRRIRALNDAKRDARYVGAAHLRLAQVAEELAQVHEAYENYMKAFDLDPSLTEATAAARRLAMKSEKWPLVFELYEREITVVSGQQKRALLLLEFALLRRDRFGELDEAQKLLVRAKKCDATNVGVHRELANTLAMHASRRTDPDRAARDRHEAADVLTGLAPLLHEADQVACLEAALDIAPEHIDALMLLERVAPHDTERLVNRWTKHVEAFPDGPITDNLRVRIAEAHAASGRGQDALPFLEELARTGDVTAALRLVELYASLGRSAEARVWADTILFRAQPNEQLALLRGVFRSFRTADPPEAVRRARAILAYDPTDAVALEYCSMICRQAEDWSGLEAFLAELAARPGLATEFRTELLIRLSRLREVELGRPHSALSTWREVESVGDRARAGEARSERIRLAERVERWDELAELLETSARASSDRDEKLSLLWRLQRLEIERRNDPQKAATVLLGLLELGAGEVEVVAELRTLLANHGLANSGLASAASASMATDTVRAYSETSRVPAHKSALSRMLARLFEGWAMHERAFEAWARVYELDPEEHEALERFSEAAKATSRFPLALDLLDRRVQRASPEMASLLHRDIARIAAEETNELDRAANALSAALEIDPSDRSVAEDLAAILARAGRFAEMSGVLSMLADSAPDRASRREVLERRARVIGGELGDPTAALEVWRTIAEETPEIEVLDRLLDDARREGDAPRTEVLLARLVQLQPVAELRREHALSRAEVLAEKLDDVPSAIAVLERSSDSDARAHMPTLKYLEALYAQTQNDAGVARTLELQVLCAPEHDRPPLFERLADLYEGPRRDDAQAMSALVRWEEVATDDVAPRLRLVPRLALADDWEGLLRRLDRLIEIARSSTDDWIRTAADSVEKADALVPRSAAQAAERDQNMAWFFLELAERTRSSSQRLGLVNRAADRFDAAGHPAPAFAAAVQALRLAGPNEGLLSRAERLAVGANATRELSDLYDAFTGEAASDEVRKVLVLRHARMLAEDAGAASDALDRLLRASALDPTDSELLDAMEKFAPAADRLSELLATYEERAVLVGSGERAVVLMCRAAQLCEQHDRLNDVQTYLGRALEFAESDPELFAHIESAAKLFGRGAMRQMVKVYEAASARAEDQPEAGAVFLFRAAELLRGDLEDAYEAFRFLKDALVLDPANVQVADVLEEIAVQRSFVQLLDSFLEERIAETLSDRAAAVLLERRARILQERLDKPSDAADAYMRLWALRPTDAHVLEKLRMCLLETGRIQDLISAYERELGRRKDPGERAALLRDIAELWENGAKNPWEARDAWKRVLRLQPNDADAKAAIQRIERSRSKPPPADALESEDEPEEILAPEDVLESDDGEPGELLPAGDELDAEEGVTGALPARAVSRSGAGSAKPSDGEWGPSESHSMGRGGEGASGGAVLESDEDDAIFEGRDTRESGERLAPRAEDRRIAPGDRSGEASAPRTAEELSEATDALLEMLEPARAVPDAGDILDDDDLLEEDESD